MVMPTIMVNMLLKLVIPCLFDSSIHYVIAKLDTTVLISLYTILIEYKDIIPESVFESIRKRLSIIIIEPIN